ncbi:putative RNA polymerase sigma factor FecI [Achromobacter ruhlandii]|uniref:sigma-70 family RNA polymerase sigma factor n=1 Tax=Achromobacter ruhlandii TaxID=72557 RepID=UPI00146819C4|nr:sigma-70 family RNA polymerase sigma factor [Achromobacter ruhlandii]CAB3742131.1 putative RNA polymerase sigma factor FecI [Achromobacter ruhlandii]
MPPGDLPAPHAVDTLYRSHHAWLTAWLRRRLRDDHDAADLAQDTFVRLIAARDTPGLREPRAFLARIAHGLMVNLWRRRDLEHAYLQALAQRPEVCAPSPERRALVLEALVEIDAMLQRLPARAREAFLLAQLGGYTYAEIGQRLDVSERMVKKYMAQVMLQCLLIADGVW